MKTEPDDYSWADLSSKSEGVWDGVKAAPAIKNMRQMKPGDQVFIYHTGQERRIVGIAEVTSFPYSDPDNQALVKVAARAELPHAVTLKMIKESKLYGDWDLVRLPRLSVVPVSEAQWQQVLRWAND